MREGFNSRRNAMVDTQLVGRGIRDRWVLNAMRKIPREAFVPEQYGQEAYADRPLPIGEGQTISQPYVVALMAEMAAIEPGDRVLEVGAGSGYAAAVLAELAESVHAIERHKSLTETAGKALNALGYDNVHLRTGDGTRGWPEHAPYDAILVAAGGDVPQPLRDQLAPGGRLVIPVGEAGGRQRLKKIVRTGDDSWSERAGIGVSFVPLVAGEAEAEPGPAGAGPDAEVVSAIAKTAEPLPDPNAPEEFGTFFDRLGDRRVVLLGEASHGTSEFYAARAAITQRLVSEHGFNIVALEADWPDVAVINRQVRHQPLPEGRGKPFQRFPKWMWRNREAADLFRWMRDHNEGRRSEDQAGLYGLDIYNLTASIDAVLAYLDDLDPDAAVIARERYACLAPWQDEPATYGRAVLSGYRACETAVVQQCQDLLDATLEHEQDSGLGALDAAQNARLITSAEKYYRTMYYGGSEAWNVRDTHMFETLCHLLDAHGAQSRAVVWAHNSHIGDARATEMGQAREQLNIGQLCRESFGGDAALVGFGTHRGTVAAADDWGQPMQVKTVRPSREKSIGNLCHRAGPKRFLLDMTQETEARQLLEEPRLERFIGVIYRPETELMSHYAEASLSRQFDFYIWLDETSAVAYSDTPGTAEGGADLYPFGL